MQQENRKFRMHPDLLYSVIKNQAGTLAKAILELVQNSVDANATKVEITLERSKLLVSDDGKGFVDEREINEFFETFGTPHTEGDARYGRFRMGRGQVMAFTRNVWRSGQFQMFVDIQKKGLDYTLKQGLEPVKGCSIEGEMYTILSPSELLDTERTLEQQCKYIPIPVILNGKTISHDPAKEKWTVITDDAYIRVSESSRQLSLFNLGCLVSDFYAGKFGVGGVVVSRKQLQVNFARNDVLWSQCEVWKRINKVISKLAAELSGKEKASKRTEEWRRFQAQNMLSWNGRDPHYTEVFGWPLFTDISGKHWSLDKLQRHAHSKSLTVAPAKTLKADKVHQQQLAVVLDPSTFDERFRCSFEDVLDRLLATVEKAETEKHWEKGYNTEFLTKIRKAIVPFEKAAASLREEHFPIDPASLPKDATLALKVLSEHEYRLARIISDATESEVKVRKLRAMKSDTAAAYTDGHSNIFIHLRYLRGAEGPNSGIPWAHHITALLCHEYLHNTDTGTGHVHDKEFHELFHEVMFSPAIGTFIKDLFLLWPKLSKSELGKVTKAVAVQLDRQAILDDRNEETFTGI